MSEHRGPSLLVVTPAGPRADELGARLAERGYSVRFVSTGSESVHMALRESPSAILMDSALSAMDRWHAVKRLNAEHKTSRIPVLTLSAEATSPAGLQRVLAKLERTIGGVPAVRVPLNPVGNRPRVQPTEPLGSEPPVRPRTAAPRASGQAMISPPTATIDLKPPAPTRSRSEETGVLLVVDDNDLNRDMLSRRLRRRGYEVHTAEDGQAALNLLNSTAVDLVLLDWMMPGLSGIDVLQRLRKRWSSVELPVIMATAKSEAEDIVEALKLEANDYVTKPLNFDVVHARIKTQLGLAHAHRELRSSAMRFRALIENTGDMIVRFGLDGDTQYVSPASQVLLGVTPQEFQSKPFFDWIHPVDQRELRSQFQSDRELPSAFTFIARMRRDGGVYSWVETSCRVLRDAARGHVVSIQAACRDVNEHMDRLAGDEPPLPLGGDIMAHPGWRSGTPAPPPTRQVAPTKGKIPVVMVGLIDGIEAEVLTGDREELAKTLGSRLLAQLEQQHG